MNLFVCLVVQMDAKLQQAVCFNIGPFITEIQSLATGCARAQLVLTAQDGLASFPGRARSSPAVRNLRRGPGVPQDVFLRQQITMFAMFPIYMYNGVSTSQARTIDYSRKL